MLLENFNVYCPMKLNTIIKLILTTLLVTGYSANGEEDEFVELDITSNKIPIQKESDQWLRISVPFKLKKHPRIEALNGRRPSSLSEAFNPKFINNIKVKIWICFPNKFKQDLLSSANIGATEFYQYYSAEVEYLTLEFDRSTKNATFLFPTPIAERDGFLEAYVKPVGYVIEISHKGTNFEMSDAVYFDYRGVTPQVLESFKSRAMSGSSENEGILFPAYKVNMNYLDGMGPVKAKD